jgi:hypothetical protein
MSRIKKKAADFQVILFELNKQRLRSENIKKQEGRG